MKKMKFSFKKIGSILASTAMLSSTVALAAAANFPAPFISGGAANVALVHGGANAAYTDLVAVTDISSYLSTELAKQTAIGGTTSTQTVTGEAAELFSSGTRLYINDTLNAIKSVLTKTELPTVLKEGSFSGNVDATYTQTIEIGFNPQITFAKQPTSSDDPGFGVTLSTTSANYLYNTTVTFNKAVNLTHPDSEGQDITMFGQKFTIASATDSTDLILLKTAERISLSNDDPSTEVIIGGKTYTIELVSASDTSATVKVTDSDGKSETKEISENASKKVGGITVAITNADETNLKLSASVIAGAEKVKMSDAGAVTTGEQDKVVDGTLVRFSAAQLGSGITKIIVSVYASNSDKDAILPGSSFVDPVFGSFKVDFAGLSIKDDDATAREEISFNKNGDDKADLSFTDSRGKTKNFMFARNLSNGLQLLADSDAKNITVFEKQNLFKGDYVVVGNEREGRLLKVTQISNQTTGFSSDKVTFTDVFTGDSIDSTITEDSTGTVTIAGKVFNVKYNGTSSADSNWVTLNYPDSTGTGGAIAFPTIETSLGAKVALYKPILNMSLNDWDGDIGANALGSIRFPDGDGYTDVTFSGVYDAGSPMVNITFGSTTTALNLSAAPTSATGRGQVGGTIGVLTYNITSAGSMNKNSTNIYLVGAPVSEGNIIDPAVIVFEEKDDNSLYQALIVTLEPGATSDDGLGIDDVKRTWHADGTWDAISLASNSKIEKEADLFGTIVTVDKGDSDQATAKIRYPGDQVYALGYVGEVASAITTSGGGAGAGGVTSLGSIAVTDSEVTSVGGKSLIVVGGSCVNTVAANLLGVSARTCGSAFTEKTGIGSGQFLIETFARTGGNVATLVAGYNAGDTTNAAKALTTQIIDTTAGKKYKGTSSTAVEAVMEDTAAT